MKVPSLRGRAQSTAAGLKPPSLPVNMLRLKLTLDDELKENAPNSEESEEARRRGREGMREEPLVVWRDSVTFPAGPTQRLLLSSPRRATLNESLPLFGQFVVEALQDVKSLFLFTPTRD